MKNNISKVTGFTMVELLVTISIIAILSAIVYANFGQARAAARDDIRKTALKEMQLSIELYKAQTGEYPPQGCVTAAWSGPGTHPSWGCTAEVYIVGLAPDFIPSLPKDSTSEYVDGQGFIYRTDGTDYKLMVHNSVEVKTVTSYDNELARCPSQGGACTGATPPANIYAVYSPGAASW